jgi:hypothetical protein
LASRNTSSGFLLAFCTHTFLPIYIAIVTPLQPLKFSLVKVNHMLVMLINFPIHLFMTNYLNNITLNLCKIDFWAHLKLLGELK